LGRRVYRYLANRGIAITAFIDKNWRALGSFEETPVISVDILGPEHSQDLIIFSILNHYIPTAPIINDLKKHAIEIWTMVDFVSIFPDGSITCYWLASKEYMRAQRENYTKLSALLADEKSKQLVESIYTFRSTGDCSILPRPDPAEYSPSDLPRWKNPMRLIDCGAFTGDTIQRIMAEGYTIVEAIALEPDPDNFTQLTTALPDINVINIPCGVARDQSQLYFEEGKGLASKLSTSGRKSIQCVSLSKLAPRFAPTLIKMDIEGAEIDALEGAKDIIQLYSPGLAIALYHEPDHLWRIPLMIHEWNLGYKFYIRTHEESTFGTILYAI